MSMTVLAAFVAACLLLAITPGPNMALIISATLGGGMRAGLATLAGTLTGLSILVAVAAIGMTSLMVLMSDWFEVVRWAGALYLVYLGLHQLRQWWRGRSTGLTMTSVSSGSRYLRGLLISLSNPKVLLFLGAFLPQFVDPELAPGPQLALLAVLFVAVLGLVDLAYTAAVAAARRRMDLGKFAVLDALSGGLLVAGGVLLAAVRRP